jgi:hypothetical protein
LEPICFTKPTLAVNRREICEGDTTLIDAGQGYREYRWNTGQQTRTIVARNGRVYWVEVTNTEGCTGRDTAILSVKPRPAVTITTLPSDTICRGRSARLSARGDTPDMTYSWSPSAGLSSTTVASPQCTQTVDGTYSYTLTVTNKQGCTQTIGTSITVEPCSQSIALTTDPEVQPSFISCDSLLTSIRITNDGDVAITIDSVSLVGGTEQGAFTDREYLRQEVSRLFPMVLAMGSVGVVPVRIIPSSTGSYVIDMVAYYGGKRRKVELAGRALSRALRMKLLGAKTEFGKEFDLPIYVESEYWNELKVREIEIEISYRSGVMKYLGDGSIRLSSSLGTTWEGKVDSVTDDANGNTKMVIRLSSGSTSGYLRKDDTLMTLRFRLLTFESGVLTAEPTLSFRLPDKRMDCTENLSSWLPVSVDVCGVGLRPVVFGEETFRLVSISPNPATTRLTVQYGIGYESYTELRLYDMNGREVSTLIKGVHKGGLFEALVDVSSLAGGVYYCTLTSAGNTFTQQLRIVR